MKEGFIIPLLLIIFFSATLTTAMGQKYKILPNEELNRIIDSASTYSHEQLPDNLAFVYELADGRVVLLPSIGSEGILFEDLGNFKEMAASKKFPVKGDGSKFEARQTEIGNVDSLNTSISNYQKLLEQIFGAEIHLDCDGEHLDMISKKIVLMGLKKFHKEHIIPLGVVFGEMIRRKIGAEWYFEKVYVLNPYYIPVLKSNNMHLPHWKWLDESFRLSSKYDPFSLKRIAIETTEFALSESSIDPKSWERAKEIWK